MNDEANTDRKHQVGKYIERGFTYRQIMDKMQFSSLSQVSYYAKGKHQHRLVAKKNPDINKRYLDLGLECQICGEWFFSQAEVDNLVMHLSVLSDWLKPVKQEPKL